jgi:hypothetical protein
VGSSGSFPPQKDIAKTDIDDERRPTPDKDDDGDEGDDDHDTTPRDRTRHDTTRRDATRHDATRRDTTRRRHDATRHDTTRRDNDMTRRRHDDDGDNDDDDGDSDDGDDDKRPKDDRRTTTPHPSPTRPRFFPHCGRRHEATVVRTLGRPFDAPCKSTSKYETITLNCLNQTHKSSNSNLKNAENCNGPWA